MITEKNFTDALKAMKFRETDGGIYEKIFDKGNFTMKVDTNTKKFIYPDAIRGRTHNDSFDDSFKENFVVFECVNRLLDKGYRPEDIELEKQWSLGHTQKGGRADICVTNGKGEMLVIIECKTHGEEFKHELANMKNDGGQLFSYWQQERSCKWLVLYTSNFDNGKLSYEIKSINCNDEIYRDAGNVVDLFEKWSTIHLKKFDGDVLFTDDTEAYRIGVKPKLKRELEDFSSATGVVNAFEEILRHNNVSDKENAFNRLVALFICKIYDEDTKADDSPVDFCFREGEEYETFQDRLQSMYHEGMQEFMNEEITYISNDDLDKILHNYVAKDRTEFLRELKQAWNQLKFYTNNDFAFVDVHNKQLFDKNAKILVEVVDLFKDYRIINSNDLQTLGDLFEQLLDKGFKQNEGQFFTPIPITRFIWDSLPLDTFIFREVEENRKKKIVENLPKIIDYACGAGHFLTEGFKAVEDCYKRRQQEPQELWEIDKIFGVEKDYRLARVSKISLFMHGVKKGNIKFGDGLDNYPDEKISPKSFDFLVSNPPFAISAFKQHLKLNNNKFYTLKKISKDGSEIETLFVERIAQLLKPNGIAAVILPSSILNKDGKSFIAARESLLKNFFIRTIVQLGSKTFSATGTNTVVMFLQRFDEPPNESALYKDTANAILYNRDISKWKDSIIFPLYVKKIGVTVDDYRKFTTKAVDYDKWIVPYFAAYVDAFKNSNEYKSKIKLRNISDADKLNQLNEAFHEYVRKVEFEKIRYFALTYEQTTLVITAPTDNNEQVKFLGYDWSNRKGAEGIQHKKGGGLLCNMNDRTDANKLSCAVRKSFGGEKVTIPNAEKYYSYIKLCDMLDFGGVDFTKTIKVSDSNFTAVKYTGEYPLVKLGSIGKVSMCKRIMKHETTANGEIPFYKIGTFGGKANAYITREKFENYKAKYPYPKKGDILISAAGTIGKTVVFDGEPAYFQDSNIVWIDNDESILLNQYLLCFYSTNPWHITKGSVIERLYNAGIENVDVPVPPMDIQRQIVNEFNAVDNEISAQDDAIKQCDADVKNKFSAMFDDVTDQITIGECCAIRKGTALTREQVVEGDVPVVAGGISPSCYHNAANRSANVITVSASGKNAGYVNLWRVPIFATDCNTLQSNDNFSIVFIFYALKIIQDEIYKLQRGSAQPHVYGKDIAKIKIPNPPLPMQDEFATFAQESDAVKEAARRRKAELLQAREQLVKKYFR